MLHRFRDERNEIAGHDPDFLADVLRLLRRHEVPIVPLEEGLRHPSKGREAAAVAFTVDDGYYDFDAIGAAVFRHFDCPVTVFLSTGFVDGAHWFWWDQLAHAVAHSSVTTASVRWRGEAQEWEVGTARDRAQTASAIAGWVKEQPPAYRRALLEKVFTALLVEVPKTPPARYRAMSWESIQRLSSEGVDFAPHGVNHVSMGSISYSASREEVRASRRALERQIGKAGRAFCYPYGLPSDLSADAAEAVRDEGMLAAVTAIPGYVGRRELQQSFALPRFALPDNETDVAQIVFGFERLKMLVRQL